MADNHTKESRSFNMSKIRSIDTKPEEIVRKFLFSKGLRYRKNDKRFPGKPDIVLPKYRTMIFINGCFWHGHENCPNFVSPKSNQGYWLPKLHKNKLNDDKNKTLLQDLGWNVITFWECQLRERIKAESLETLFLEIINMRSKCK